MVSTSPDSPLGQLLAGPMRPGKLVWIGLRPSRKMPVLKQNVATLVSGRGIIGDHYDTRQNGPRQVTLIATEDMAAMASFLGKEDIAPELLRRNFVTQGINLVALKGRRFRIGPALLEWSGECAPCSRMDTNLGSGGFNAVRGRGGITARVIEGGEVHIGDLIERVD
jgi:MOSC domain-containing protein YiiM